MIEQEEKDSKKTKKPDEKKTGRKYTHDPETSVIISGASGGGGTGPESKDPNKK